MIMFRYHENLSFNLYKIQKGETAKLEERGVVGRKKYFGKRVGLKKFENIFLTLPRVQISDIKGVY